MQLGLIVATDKNGIIGVNNTLPWHKAEDLKRFREVTQGSVLVFGRRTWESIRKPLQGRRVLVVTHHPLGEPSLGAEAVGSIPEALEAAKDSLYVWFGGGEVLYQQALCLPDLKVIDLTVVDEVVPLPLYESIPVARFPGVPSDFLLVSEEMNPKDPTLTHRVYHRKKPSLMAMKAVVPPTP